MAHRFDANDYGAVAKARRELEEARDAYLRSWDDTDAFRLEIERFMV
jgi:hypothetical protein